MASLAARSASPLFDRMQLLSNGCLSVESTATHTLFSSPPFPSRSCTLSFDSIGRACALGFLLKAMYIRVKRNKTTYFVHCDPTETILRIKQKLHSLIDQLVNNQRLILVSNDQMLDDSKTLAEQKVENDAIVALTLRKVQLDMEICTSIDIFISLESNSTEIL
ncbi:hypothetical protein Taro_014145 [Colocasia esculenta]|uniref:Ubiquitin-like domain-containing protein n=2 Tax=Magnoliopsida TaxID=3398 RepID=A0A843UI27_COLES|nr:hypothetical protein [Colocasia esculenta]